MDLGEGEREVHYDVRLPPSSTRDVGSGGETWDQLRPPPKLTRRQREVLEQVVHGRSNKEIAAKLSCAENTVEFHLTALYRKFDVTSRAELIARVLRRRA